MIVINTICTCDRCDKVVTEGTEFFKIKKEKVPFSNIKPATNYQVFHYGYVSSFEDQYKAYHVCSDCSEDLINFLENAE